MMGRVGTWALGLVVSAVAHIGLGAALMAALQPQDIPDQPRATSSLSVTPEVVTRSDAAEQAPATTDVAGEDAEGTALGAGAVETSTAQEQALPQPSTESAALPTDTAAVTKLPADSTAPQANTAEKQVAMELPSTSQDAASPTTEVARANPPDASPAAPSITPTSRAAPATAPEAQVSAATWPSTEVSRAEAPETLLSVATPLQSGPAKRPQDPTAELTVAALPQSATAAPQTPPQKAAAPQEPEGNALNAAIPEVTATKAVLAFPNTGGGAVDPASLAAFQGFTQPENAGTMRDDLQSLLSLPCARMQVNFDPLSTTLQLTGHVPEESQRAPVLAALQAQMGSDITVTDNLLVLPAPQCGALSGIAGVGLPQSTDQITNPLIVGKDTHARSFRYIKNDPLVLNLTAPDYPAYVYVDYFDADGNVIHLSPNIQAPLKATQPKELLQIGARAADEPGLMVIIGPPYGQEIAVAFAASAPLYQQERPLVEPAAPYLAWLKEQVATTRANTPDFKGEWVYFFVQTAPE